MWGLDWAALKRARGRVALTFAGSAGVAAMAFAGQPGTEPAPAATWVSAVLAVAGVAQALLVLLRRREGRGKEAHESLATRVGQLEGTVELLERNDRALQQSLSDLRAEFKDELHAVEDRIGRQITDGNRALQESSRAMQEQLRHIGNALSKRIKGEVKRG